MYDCRCPYCGESIDDPDDCYEPDITYEWECPHCGKNFVFTVDYIRTYHEKEADCLNGGSHDYEMVNIYPKLKFTKVRCKMCGDTKIINEKEQEK